MHVLALYWRTRMLNIPMMYFTAGKPFATLTVIEACTLQPGLKIAWKIAPQSFKRARQYRVLFYVLKPKIVSPQRALVFQPWSSSLRAALLRSFGIFAPRTRVRRSKLGFLSTSGRISVHMRQTVNVSFLPVRRQKTRRGCLGDYLL